MNFNELNLSSAMLLTLEKMEFLTPTQIQEKVIPAGLQGKDVIGQAQTGTGKTAAFGIPIVENSVKGKGLQHLILAPSRELAIQIWKKMKLLADHTNLKIVDIVGGVSYTLQERKLKENPEIIVATPGRLLDYVDKGAIDLSKLSSLTLDEADEMLNFGFYKDILKIKSFIKTKPQTFFLTATFNQKTRELADKLLQNPVNVSVSEGLSTSSKITQNFILVKEDAKFATLQRLLSVLKFDGIVIFGRTKRRVEELTQALTKLGLHVVGLQGDMRQREREKSMNDFRHKKANILVTTDVAARGIDVEHVDYVINFDLPTEIEYYTHRIGRTGRANKEGIAISFVKTSEDKYFELIMKTTSSNAKEWVFPSEKELVTEKSKEALKFLEALVLDKAADSQEFSIELANKYSKEELSTFLASLLFKKSKTLSNVSLSPEPNAGDNKKYRSKSTSSRSPRKFKDSSSEKPQWRNKKSNDGQDRNRTRTFKPKNY